MPGRVEDDWTASEQRMRIESLDRISMSDFFPSLVRFPIHSSALRILVGRNRTGTAGRQFPGSLPMPSKFARQAAGAAWWSAVEIAARYGVQFLVTLVLARLLLPSDFGLAALLVIFTSLGAVLVDSGFGTALIQRQHTSADDETTVFVFSILAAAMLCGLLAFAAPFIAGFFRAPALSPLLRLASLTLVLSAAGAVPDALLTMRMNFRARTQAQLVASLVSGTVAVTLALNGAGVWSLVWQLVTAAAIRSLCLWVCSRWRPAGRFNRASLTGLAKFGSFMLLSSLLNSIYVQLQPLLIGRLFDTRSLGFFTLAQNSQQAPMSLVGGVLTRVGLPVFSALAHAPSRMLDALRPILRLSMFVFVPCMVGIAITAEPLVTLVYGPRWLPAAPILSILALAGTLWPVHVLNLEAIKAQGRSDLFFRLALAKVSLAIVLVVLGSPWGAIGVAWATLVASVLNAAINTYYSWKLLGFGPRAQMREQAPTFALAITAALVGWAVLHWMPATSISMVLSIACAGVVYLGLAWAFRVQALTDLHSFIHTLRADATLKPDIGNDLT
jgi:O-antigen/teichoic acid export membrane protein